MGVRVRVRVQFRVQVWDVGFCMDLTKGELRCRSGAVLNKGSESGKPRADRVADVRPAPASRAGQGTRVTENFIIED